jgi:enamine deaminase RidA (YjgF/YER057c/UK114 family)
MSISERLRELNLTLPAAPKPVAAYIPAVRSGHLLFISGQLPMKDGAPLATGLVPTATSLDAAQSAGKQCVLNALAIAAAELGGNLDAIQRVVRIGVFVASTPEFTEQHKVANGASELLVEIFGERGRHARAAVGVAALPLNASVEIEFLLEVA